jgi:hypothetical protein
LDITTAGTVSGAITGAGILRFDGKTTFDGGATLSAVTLIETANITLGTGEGLTEAAGHSFEVTAAASTITTLSGASGDIFTNSGSLLANGAGTADIAVAFVNDASAVATSGTLAFLDAVSGAGTFSAGTLSIIDLKGGGTLTGAIAGAGTVRIDGKTTLDAGANLSAATLIETANLTLGTGASLTETASHRFEITVAASAVATLSGSGGDTFTNSGSLLANGAGAADVALAFVNKSTVLTSSGTLSFSGAFTNDGTIQTTSGTTLIDEAPSGSGTLSIGTKGTLSLLSGASSGQIALFSSSSGLSDLASPIHFLGSISDFAGTAKIDLINTAETGFSYASNTLTVTDNGNTVASLHFNGTYVLADFSLSSDGHSGTDVTFV